MSTSDSNNVNTFCIREVLSSFIIRHAMSYMRDVALVDSVMLDLVNTGF